MHYFLITLIFFSSIEVVSKELMEYMGPFEMTFFRFSLGLAGLLLYSVAKGTYKDFMKLGRKDYSLMSLLGFINIFFSMSVLQYAIKHGSPAVVALIFSSNPIFVYAISVFLKNDLLCMKKISGFILGLAGLAVVLIDDIKYIELEKGALFALAGSVSFAIFTVLNRKAVKDHRPVIVNIVSFAFGLMFIAVYFLIRGSLDFSPEIFDSAARTVRLVYLGIFVTAVGYITFLNAIKTMGPVASSLIFLFKPALATVFALILINERIGMNFYAGLILSAAGSYLILKKNKIKASECVR